jgi:hypothetical protein
LRSQKNPVYFFQREFLGKNDSYIQSKKEVSDMVDLAKITKEDAKTAAIEFLATFAMWTDCFYDGKAGARLLKIDEASYNGGDRTPVSENDEPTDEEIKSYIAGSHLEDAVFVKKIVQIFDFAKSGIETEYEDGYGILDLMIEFGSFRHVFRSKPDLCFKDNGINQLDERGLDILLAVTETAYARWSLTEFGSVTLEDMALLAGVSIKTIRNAVSSKGHDKLILSGSKDSEGKLFVDSNEAYRWLVTKRGFTGPFSYDEEPSYQTYEIFGHFRHHCFVLRKLAKFEITDLSKSMDWDDSLTDAYINLENLVATESLELLTPAVLMALGKFYQSKNLTTFVVEGSKILASVVAELRAKTLFI